MGSGLTTPARDFHRARSPRIQVSRWQIALLGILLEGLSGNRHRLPHQEPSHNRSPAVLRLIFGSSLAREPSPQVLQRHPRVARLSGSGVKPISCRCFGRTSALHPRREASRWHPRVARQSSIDSSARRPCLQVPQWHPRVARGASIGTLTRRPSTEALLGQGHVARLSGTGVKPFSCRCFGRTSARHPRREASRWHPGVARQSSIGSSARRPLPQAPQWHPRVAKGASIDPLAREPSIELLLGQGHVARLSGSGVKPVSCRCFGRTSPRHPRREASRWRPGMARQSSIGSSSIKCRYSMDIVVRIGCSSMKCRYSMDIEVRIGCLSIKCRCFMDVEVRMGCLSMKCRYSMDIEVRIGFLSMKCRYSMDVEVRMGFSARCRVCGNSRLCRNVVELASLPFLPNEGACPKYTPSARIHCILERTLVSLTPKHPFSQFHPCQSVSEDRLFYEYDFSNKLGDIFS